MRSASIALSSMLVASIALGAQSHTGQGGHDGHATAAPASVAPSPARPMTPQPVITDIRLRDAQNQPSSLAEILAGDDPVFVNFIFTTCTTVCPVMSAGFAAFQARLGADRNRVRLVSISVDPEIDTPARLREYASRHHAGSSWRFFTGTAADIEAAQRVFGAYRGGKTNHVPATYVRRSRTAPWEMAAGLSSAETLLALYRGRS